MRAARGRALSWRSRRFAHHSFAMFDRDKEVTLAGTVREFQWTNPHAFIEMDVPDDKGSTAEKWSVEMNSPNNLTRQGWKSSMLKAGDKVSVTMNPLRDGKKGGLFVVRGAARRQGASRTRRAASCRRRSRRRPDVRCSPASSRPAIDGLRSSGVSGDASSGASGKHLRENLRELVKRGRLGDNRANADALRSAPHPRAARSPKSARSECPAASRATPARSRSRTCRASRGR